MRHPILYPVTNAAFPAPGASATVVLFDDSTAKVGRPAPSPSNSHVRVAFLLDQPVTFVVKWAPNTDAPDGALQIINGPTQTGVVVAANTFGGGDVILQPGRNQISVVAGATPPTANFIAVESNSFDGLIQ
nr:hypothetical protein [uncultured Rhodopila sp.]